MMDELFNGPTPTSPWRSAMTLPRDLNLSRVGNRLYLRSTLSPETAKLVTKSMSTGKVVVNDSTNIGEGLDFSKAMVTGSIPAKDFTIELFNDQGQNLVIGFDQRKNHFFVDRGSSGSNNFSPNFKARAVTPRISTREQITFTLVADVSSVEVFFDDGLSVMTTLFFPDAPLAKMKIKAPAVLTVENLEVKQLRPVWR